MARKYVSDDVAVVSLAGEVNVYTVVSARNCVMEAVNSGRYFLVLDMRRTDFLDSTGLGVIVGGVKRCRSHDGAVAVVVGSLDLVRIFRITGLNRVFRIFNDVAAAVEAMSSPDPSVPGIPDPREYQPPRRPIELEVYVPDSGKCLLLRNSLLVMLRGFAVEPAFLLPDDTGSGIREAVLALSAPVSTDGQVRLVCDALRKGVEAVPRPDGTAEVIAVMKAARYASIRLGTKYIGYANDEIETGILIQEDPMTDDRKKVFRDPEALVRALKPARA